MTPPDLERLFYAEEPRSSSKIKDRKTKLRLTKTEILTGGGVSSSPVTHFDVALTRANAYYDLAEGKQTTLKQR